MTRTEDQLRAALHDRAERLSPPIDVFTAVETRAKRLHRHRVAGAIGAVAAAVVAIAVVLPTVVVGHHHRTPTVGPSPITSSPAQPSADPLALDPARPWAYRGDRTITATATLDVFRRAWAAKHPGSTLQPLWGEVYEPSGQPELIFVAEGADGARWGFAMKSATGADLVIDQPLPARTRALVAAVPGDEVPRLLAVAGPTVAKLQYAPDGVSFQDMYAIAPGVAVRALEGDTAKDRVRVLGSDGKTLYEAAAPNAS